MTERDDPMQKVYDAIDAVIDEAGADDPDLLGELTQAWGRNALVVRHIRFRLGPPRAQFDAHMVGESVIGHAARAESVADLLKGITEASKEIAKAARGWASMPNDYLVHGVMPGSVRLLIEAPDRARKNPKVALEPENAPTREAFHVPSHESNALRTVANVLSSATPTLDDGGADALIRDLPVHAWQPLKSVATSVKTGAFELEGEVRERSTRPVELIFDPDQADTLARAIDRTPIPPKTVNRRGVIDGFRKTSRTVYLAPESGPSVSLHVPDDDLLAIAAMLATADEQWVHVRYIERTREGVPSRNRQNARILEAIEPIDPPAKMQQDEITGFPR